MTLMTLFLVMLLILIQDTISINWQSHGNFSIENITIISNKITLLIPSLVTNSIPYQQAALTLSSDLNTLWDPAWNVIISYISMGDGDGVVDGYAFRQHWLWFNDHTTSRLSFIIWKDYNCADSGWLTYNYANTGNSLSNSDPLYISINSDFSTWMAANPQMILDPWLSAQHLMEYAQNTALPGSAWTVIGFGYNINTMFYGGRFCCYQKTNRFIWYIGSVPNVMNKTNQNNYYCQQ